MSCPQEATKLAAQGMATTLGASRLFVLAVQHSHYLLASCSPAQSLHGAEGFVPAFYVKKELNFNQTQVAWLSSYAYNKLYSLICCCCRQAILVK